MPRTAIDVITAALRRAGVAQADMHARTIAADLTGNGYPLDTDGGVHARRRTTAAPREYCQRPIDPHSGTQLVGKTCPTCGWTKETL